jgi:hypothetical protein
MVTEFPLSRLEQLRNDADCVIEIVQKAICAAGAKVPDYLEVANCDGTTIGRFTVQGRWHDVRSPVPSALNLLMFYVNLRYGQKIVTVVVDCI